MFHGKPEVFEAATVHVHQHPAAIEITGRRRDPPYRHAGDHIVGHRDRVRLALLGAHQLLYLLGERPHRRHVDPQVRVHRDQRGEVGAGLGAQGLRRRRHVPGGLVVGHWSWPFSPLLDCRRRFDRLFECVAA